MCYLGNNLLFKDPPELNEVMKYSEVLEKKTEELVEQLKIKNAIGLSLKKVLEAWETEHTVPYTWDELLSALRAIGEIDIAKQIEGEAPNCIIMLYSNFI